MPSLKAPVPPALPELFSLNRGRLHSGDLARLARLFLMLYIPLAVVASVFLYAVALLQVERQMNVVRTNEAGQVQFAANLLTHDIETLSADLRILARSPALSLYLESGSETNRARLDELFRSYSREKQFYEQIRYIDADGYEQVKVKYGSDGASSTHDQDLEFKGERYYFLDLDKLAAGEVYISPFDLNVEHQQIESPLKPTFRLGTPVFDRAGVKRGFVILNVFGTQLLNDFRRAMGETNHAMLINRDGYWLSHPDSSLEWGFMFGRETTLASSDPDAWQHLLVNRDGSFVNDTGLFTFTTVYPLLANQHSSTGSPLVNGSSLHSLNTEQYFWKVVSLVPAAELSSASRHIYTSRIPELSLTLVLMALLTAFLAIALLNHRQWQQAVFENEKRLREITATLGEGVYVLDREGIVTFVNPEAERMLGWSEGELLGKNGHDTFHSHRPDGKPLAAKDCPVHITIRTGKLYHALHDWLICKNGKLFPVSIISTPIVRNNEVVGSVAAFQDITPRLEAEKTLRKAETLFRSALENAPIGMAIVALDGCFTKVNHELCRIVGYAQEELEKLTFAEITHPDDLDADMSNVQQLLDGIIDTYQMEKRYIRKSGEMVWVQLTASLMRDEEKKPLYFLAQIEDISERKQHLEQIRKLAFYDTLTGLPNRRLFLEHFEQALTQAKRHHRSMAVMFLDLDHFKQVNDTLGHDAGDELLQEVARRLVSSVRRGDTVSRQGGDEFVIILAETAHPENASQVAEKILDALRVPITLHGQPVQIGVSIGIAIYPLAGVDSVQELMKKADIAMYVAKARGRNQFRFADDEAVA